MLPAPWPIPKDIYKEFLQIDRQFAHVDSMAQDLTYSNQVVDDRRDETAVMLDKWYTKVTGLMLEAKVDVENECIGGMRVDKKRKQIVFLDEHDTMMEALEKYPKDMRDAMKLLITPYLKTVEPSDEMKDQMIADVFKNRVKI